MSFGKQSVFITEFSDFGPTVSPMRTVRHSSLTNILLLCKNFEKEVENGQTGKIKGVKREA
jgi:hypothetical protein